MILPSPHPLFMDIIVTLPHLPTLASTSGRWGWYWLLFLHFLQLCFRVDLHSDKSQNKNCVKKLWILHHLPNSENVCLMMGDLFIPHLNNVFFLSMIGNRDVQLNLDFYHCQISLFDLHRLFATFLRLLHYLLTVSFMCSYPATNLDDSIVWSSHLPPNIWLISTNLVALYPLVII